ncbi:DUF3999 family protein [Pontibacter pamirensis]|uniref:DUF3999 family protein n=1 Tax=Pontibacter pamirensis TaxID=2562824 RepID=UPI00138A26D0|nr:DUF3999 family protein [Pontibacter pamirensis]
MHKLLFSILLLLSGSTFAKAQEYEWKAPVAPAPEKGYYRILLSPEVRGNLQADLSDVRLINEQQQEVPYLLRSEQPVQYKKLFKPYIILHYDRDKDCCSELLIENTDKRKIDNISLLIKNADVQKQVRLSGSDDRENWFVLKAQDVLHTLNSTESTARLRLLEFPLNDYRYLRLQLNDSSSAPLNILQAGYYDTQTETGQYTAIPVQQVTRTDSARYTYIRLQFAGPAYPEQLDMNITSPALYLREGYVIAGKATPTRKRKRRRRLSETEPVRVNFTLNANAPARIALPRRQVQELTIVIDNADNPPLQIADITPLQFNRYLVANLEANETYTLYFGDKDAAAPLYDLEFFSDSIPSDLPVLMTTNIHTVTERQQATGWNASKFLLWAAIGVVVAGLGYMTVRMLREMEREKGQ